jgi:hypothetical protein
MFGSQTIRADLEFVAVTGQAHRDMAALRQDFARTTGAMSDEALRAAISQEKLDRAIAKNGPESLAAKRALLSYRSEMAALSGQAHRTASGLAVEERELGRLGRGALAGSGALNKLGRAAIFASSSVLGGYGLAYAVKSLVKAAQDEQTAVGRVDVALRDSGLSAHAWKSRIDEALDSQVKLTGFLKDDLANALAANIRRYGDVNKALQANAIAADVARAKGISLADAQNLINRASFGNPRSLRTLNIEVTKTTTNMDALKASTKNATAEQIANAKAADQQANETAALQAVFEKYHGSAARYLQTSAGKQALFNSELHRTEAIIGTALLPTFNHLLTGLADYLDKMDRTGRLQHDVNTASYSTGSASSSARSSPTSMPSTQHSAATRRPSNCSALQPAPSGCARS